MRLRRDGVAGATGGFVGWQHAGTGHQTGLEIYDTGHLGACDCGRKTCWRALAVQHHAEVEADKPLYQIIYSRWCIAAPQNVPNESSRSVSNMERPPWAWRWAALARSRRRHAGALRKGRAGASNLAAPRAIRLARNGQPADRLGRKPKAALQRHVLKELACVRRAGHQW